MKPTSITVVAGPGRSCPIPPAALRSPTGATVVIVEASDRARRPHELVGPVTIELTDPRIAHYIRRRLGAGDLELVAPAPATRSTSSSTATSSPAPTSAPTKD